jgi:3-deoxy-D-manno-octulosonate 8-phosphate phosphatase (KDO 8-P phosphatase)
MDWSVIQLLVMDVDGVLTDGRLYPSPGGGVPPAAELDAKVFHVQDGCAIRLWISCGGQAAFLSGRKSIWTHTRARELGVTYCRMGMADKLTAFEQLCREAGVQEAQSAYVGDDLPDLPPMKRCGLAIAVADAVPAVKRAAALVTRRGGGAGALSEAVEYLLRRQGRWSRARLTTEPQG